MRIGLSFKQPLMGDAVACLLEGKRGWTSAFVARSVSEALTLAGTNPIAVLVADTAGMEADELQALVELHGCGSTSVVLLAAEADASPYLDLPIERVVSRRAPSEELFSILDDLARPSGRSRSSSLPFELSRRELECAQLVARGLSNRRIAEMTGLREQSVKNVVSLAMRKLSVENRVQVALRLSQAGADVLPVQAVVSISMPSASSKSAETSEGVGATRE